MMLLAIILLWFLVQVLSTKRNNRLQSYLVAIVVWTFWMYASTEILSIEANLNRKSLVISWGLFDAVLMFTVLISAYRRKSSIKMRNLLIYFKKVKIVHVVFILFSIAMIMLAILTTPYNWDSMTYHLSRIMHWIQNASVGHYATGDLRQISSPPLAEFINLNLMILMDKNDRLVNLVQCLSYLTNTIVLYYICKSLKLKKRYAYIACLLFISMPIAFSEAFTTQVDQLSTLWVLIFVYTILDLLVQKERIFWTMHSAEKIVILSCCIGFGYLTKPSVMVAFLVFSIWMVIVCIKRRDSFRIIVEMLLMSIGIIAILTAPEILRNISTFHSISAPIAGRRQLIGTLDIRYVFVCCLKNLCTNLPNIYFYDGNILLQKIVYKLGYILHVDVDAVSIAEDGKIFELNRVQEYGHDTAVNPIVMIGFILICIYLVYKIVKSDERDKLIDYFTIVVCVAFIGFCMILRWEPFVSRYMLTYFALLCPAIAGQLQVFENMHQKGSNIVNTIFVFMCLVELYGVAYYNYGRYLEQRNEVREYGYFSNCEYIAENYLDAINCLKHKQFKQLGLLIGGNSYEYPLWSAFTNHDIQIEAINVTNESGVYEDELFSPEYIVVIDCGDMNEFTYHGRTYMLTYSFSKYENNVYIYTDYALCNVN